MMLEFKEVCELHALRSDLGTAIINVKDVIDCNYVPSEMKKQAIDVVEALEKMCKEIGRIKAKACNETIKEIKESPLY